MDQTQEKKPPVFEGETPALWKRLRESLGRDAEQSKTILLQMGLSPRLDSLFRVASEEHDELEKLEQAAVGQEAILAKTNERLRLAGMFPPKTLAEAEKVAAEQNELQERARTAAQAIERGTAAKHARSGLRLAFFELFQQPATKHDGYLSSWLLPAKTAAEAAKLGINLYKLGHWREATRIEFVESEEQRIKRYQSF